MMRNSQEKWSDPHKTKVTQLTWMALLAGWGPNNLEDKRQVFVLGLFKACREIKSRVATK